MLSTLLAAFSQVLCLFFLITPLIIITRFQSETYAGLGSLRGFTNLLR